MVKDVILFLDTGIDDAAALVLALQEQKMNILAVVSVRGNVSAKQAGKNTLKVLEFLGSDIPVFCGLKVRISLTRFNVSGVHGGKDGLGGYDFKKPKRRLKSFLSFLRFFRKLKQKVTIVATAPLTSLGLMVKLNKRVKNKIDEIYVQNGMLEDPTYSSFNVAFDPKAADIIFSSGIKTTICPSDMGHRASLNQTDLKKIQKMGKTGQMLDFIFKSYKDRIVKNNVATHDSCLIFCFSNEKAFKFKYVVPKIEYHNKIGILTFEFSKTKTNTRVCVDMDQTAFKNYFFDAVKKSK